MKNFYLIDASGNAYITDTERKVLNKMILEDSSFARTARKEYKIYPYSSTIEDIKNEIKKRFDSSLNEGRPFEFERKDLRNMLDLIKAAEKMYNLFVFEVTDPDGRKYQQFFFNTHKPVSRII